LNEIEQEARSEKVQKEHVNYSYDTTRPHFHSIKIPRSKQTFEKQREEILKAIQDEYNVMLERKLAIELRLLETNEELGHFACLPSWCAPTRPSMSACMSAPSMSITVTSRCFLPSA